MARIDLWSEAQIDDLEELILSTVSSVGPLSILDITVLGSYCYGADKDGSDMDVIAWVESLPNERIGYQKYDMVYFDDIPVNITLRLNSRKSEKFRGYTLPKYSIITDELLDLNKTSLTAWVNWCIANKEGYKDGRDFTNFIGNKTGLQGLE